MIFEYNHFQRRWLNIRNLDFELITQIGTRGKLYVNWHKNVYIKEKFHPALGNLTKDIVDLLIEPDLKKRI